MGRRPISIGRWWGGGGGSGGILTRENVENLGTWLCGYSQVSNSYNPTSCSSQRPGTAILKVAMA